MSTSRNLYPDGPLMKKQVSAKASLFGHAQGSFNASNGWLECWKKAQHEASSYQWGVRRQVRGETVSSCREWLPEIVAGYHENNVWNRDKCLKVWRWERSQQRATITFGVNTAGEITKKFPGQSLSQCKVWMSREIMHCVLKKLNQQHSVLTDLYCFWWTMLVVIPQNQRTVTVTLKSFSYCACQHRFKTPTFRPGCYKKNLQSPLQEASSLIHWS